MSVLWGCSNTHHPRIRAPERMAKDDIRRFCMLCSNSSGRLVQRQTVRSVRKKAKHAEMEQVLTNRRATLRKILQRLQNSSLWSQVEQGGVLVPQKWSKPGVRKGTKLYPFIVGAFGLPERHMMRGQPDVLAAEILLAALGYAHHSTITKAQVYSAYNTRTPARAYAIIWLRMLHEALPMFTDEHLQQAITMYNLYDERRWPVVKDIIPILDRAHGRV